MKNCIFGFLFFLQISAQAYLMSPSLTWSELQATIENKKITTVDDLLPNLPESLRKNALFVYYSHALNTYLVTPASPRVILFNEDASLILAFTKNPGQAEIRKGNDTLEVISFNQKTAKYELRNLVFNGADIPFQNKQTQINPSRCLECHGSNPRPIFQDYNAWPGFYGSFSQKGLATKGSLEHSHLQKFLDQKSELPRYKDLDTSHYKNTESGTEMSSPLYTFGPQAAFGMGIQRNMEFRLAKKILDHPQLNKFKFFLAYVGSDLSTCAPIRQRVSDVYDGVFSSPERQLKAQKILSEIRSRVKADFNLKVTSFNKFNQPDKKTDPRGVINLFANTLLTQGNDPFYSQNRESLEKQLVLFSLFADTFGLTSEDISSFPEAPTLGLIHILRLGLYSDEQLFLGLTEAMLFSNPFSLPRIENSCTTSERSLRLKKMAIAEAEKLTFNDSSTVFEPVEKTK